MSNPIVSPTRYYDLEKLKLASEALANANGLRGYDPVLRDSKDRPLELGAAGTNAIAHALSSAYLAYDHSTLEASGLGWAREHKSYWLEPKRPAAWDTFKDLYNNQVGRNIAHFARRNNLSRDQIQDLVLDALSTGKLIVTQQDKRVDPSFNGNPGNFSVPVGDAAPWSAPSTGFPDFASSVIRVLVASPSGSGNTTLLPAGNGNNPPASVFDTGAPAAPFVPPNDFLSPNRQDSFDDRFRNWSSASAGRSGSPPMPVPSRSPGSVAALIMDHIRALKERDANKSQASVFDTGAPAVPFLPSNESSSPEREDSLDDRFGGWPPIRRVSSAFDRGARRR
jgi:hypothetical protein